ncbi:hypothetical protein EVAR_83951_1 [Eumeta japonica]|uniref:Uncharacterized protein n=1 Tax=Eumeta variegata TaxID=151549 RepID=A0A4C1VNM0_EUMVA|nr:hypothetical protein EVAR_83951_1 [Eumeta japonica]
MNSAIIRATERTTAYMMFGRELRSLVECSRIDPLSRKRGKKSTSPRQPAGPLDHRTRAFGRSVAESSRRQDPHKRAEYLPHFHRTREYKRNPPGAARGARIASLNAQ